MIDDKVGHLLHELEVTRPERFELVQAVRQVLSCVVPDVSERVMYGGFVFSGAAQFCGLFAYKEHVSVEFGRGCDLDDPHGVPEGSGKLRRHIKLFSEADITAMHLEHYLHAAYRNSCGS